MIFRQEDMIIRQEDMKTCFLGNGTNIGGYGETP